MIFLEYARKGDTFLIIQSCINVLFSIPKSIAKQFLALKIEHPLDM